MEMLREKIAQMIMVGCQGERLSGQERLIFSEYQFGGFILFRRNCRAPRQIVSLCRELWNLAADRPPFIAIDEEGGSVHRLPEPFSRFPAAALIGARGDPQLAYRAGRATATELSLTGINLNFAPVLDVNCNSSNPVIAARAFGADPKSVIAMALAWARGSRDAGVIPCGKHFPGHGGTDRDSHLELPIVGKSWAELQAIDLPPFAEACRSGIEALMTAHVKFPALDPTHMATLSEAVVTGLLRHQLGYNGLVFSDDMEMKAVSERWEAREAAALSLRAGVDVMLFCHDLDKAVHVVESLCDATRREAALRAQVEASSRRSSALKERYLKEFTGAEEENLEDRLGTLNHRRLIEEIYGSL